jgi:hypothetical protein
MKATDRLTEDVLAEIDARARELTIESEAKQLARKATETPAQRAAGKIAGWAGVAVLGVLLAGTLGVAALLVLRSIVWAAGLF